MLEAIKKWFDIYFAFPPAHYVRFPLSISTQLAQCIVMLYRLSTYDYPGWDCSLVRQTYSLSEMMDKIVHRFAQVESAAGLDYNDDLPTHVKLFSNNLQKLTSILEWWQAKESALNGAAGNGTPTDRPVESAPIDPSEDAWLNDVLMMGDLQYEPPHSNLFGSQTDELMFGP